MRLGIGLEIARGLARRGASLILPCRNPEKGRRVAEALGCEVAPGATVDLVELDLEDLDAVRRGADAIARTASGRPVDAARRERGRLAAALRRDAQGFEIAFGVNVLAHFALRRELAAAGVLGRARVVVLTGDIYVLASECTPRQRWSGPLGGMLAYCRSKLGNVWIAAQLARRSPALEVAVAHPGVVATNLGGNAGALVNRFKRRFMIPPSSARRCRSSVRPSPGSRAADTGTTRTAACGSRRTIRLADEAAAARLWGACEALGGS